MQTILTMEYLSQFVTSLTQPCISSSENTVEEEQETVKDQDVTVRSCLLGKGQSIRNILCFPTKLEKEKTFQMHDSVVEASEGMRISKLQGLINLSK